MNWLQCILYGLLAGLADILPVSAQAHKILLLNLFGESAEPVLLRLLVHIGTLVGLYYGCQNQIIRMTRAKKLARVPKRRRKRPLDTRSLMDMEVLKTMLIPIIIGFLFYNSAYSLGSNLMVVSVFLLINGLILYIPRFMPGSNKDSRSMSRIESFLMGLGGTASMLPGISCVGTVTSVGSVCGAERSYALDTALLINIPVTLGLVVYDLLAIFTGGLSGLSFLAVLNYILAAAASFGGVFLGTKILRILLKNLGLDVFAYYSWGVALFSFILFLNI